MSTATIPTPAKPTPRLSDEEAAARIQASIQAAAVNPKTLLCHQAVQVLTGMSRTTIWRRIKTGDFPAPVDLGGGQKRWPAAVVHGWLDGVAGGTVAQA